MAMVESKTPRYGKKRKRLTPKQEAFAEAVASGDANTLTGAYREAGYGSDEAKPHTLHCNASRLAAHTDVAPRIAEHQEAIARSIEAKHAGGRRWVLKRLQEEASDPDSTPNARVAALGQLAKATGLHDERSAEEKRASSTEEELIAELNARLAPYLDQPVDVSPTATAVQDQSGPDPLPLDSPGNAIEDDPDLPYS